MEGSCWILKGLEKTEALEVEDKESKKGKSLRSAWKGDAYALLRGQMNE